MSDRSAWWEMVHTVMGTKLGVVVKGFALPPVGWGRSYLEIQVWECGGSDRTQGRLPGGGVIFGSCLQEKPVVGRATVPCKRTSSSLDQDPFLTAPGQPLPGEGDGLAQVLAVGRLLYLGQAQSAQEGTYTCECSNAAGTSSQKQQLEVLGEPCWRRVRR